MSRHIDADTLKEKAKWYNIYSDKPPHSIRAVTTQEIDWMPTIEPERKTGRWSGYNTDKEGWKRTDSSPVFMVCSECNAVVLNNGAAYWNFCPGCGADMRGENADK